MRRSCQTKILKFIYFLQKKTISAPQRGTVPQRGSKRSRTEARKKLSSDTFAAKIEPLLILLKVMEQILMALLNCPNGSTSKLTSHWTQVSEILSKLNSQGEQHDRG